MNYIEAMKWLMYTTNTSPTEREEHAKWRTHPTKLETQQREWMDGFIFLNGTLLHFTKLGLVDSILQHREAIAR